MTTQRYKATFERTVLLTETEINTALVNEKEDYAVSMLKLNTGIVECINSVKRDWSITYTDLATQKQITKTVRRTGKYEYQEDAAVVGIINTNTTAQKVDQETVSKTTDKLQELIIKHLGDAALDTGATLSMNLIKQDISDKNKFTIHGGDVGDSRRFVVIIDEKGSVTSSTRLNKTLHNPSTKEEVMRIKTSNKNAIFAGRINGQLHALNYDEKENKFKFNGADIPQNTIIRLNPSGLAVSRALGDTHQEHAESGLIAKAELTTHTIDIPKNGRAIVFETCDGAFEGQNPNEEEKNLKECLNELGNLKDLPAVDIAHHVKETAITQYGSLDNITVIATILDPTKPLLKDHECLFAAAIDGHAGKLVAEFISLNLSTVLQKTLRNENIDASEIKLPAGFVKTEPRQKIEMQKTSSTPAEPTKIEPPVVRQRSSNVRATPTPEAPMKNTSNAFAQDLVSSYMTGLTDLSYYRLLTQGGANKEDEIKNKSFFFKSKPLNGKQIVDSIQALGTLIKKAGNTDNNEYLLPIMKIIHHCLITKENKVVLKHAREIISENLRGFLANKLQSKEITPDQVKTAIEALNLNNRKELFTFLSEAPALQPALSELPLKRN